jgi:hypothetical protein
MSKSARIKNNRDQGKNAKKKNALAQREIPWGGIAFFTVIGLVAVIAIGYTFMQTRSSSANTSIAGLVVKDDLGRDHTNGPVKYENDPPMGGDHNPVWQNCDGRVYDAPLKNENAVHSLEHGAVWITYRPDLAADQLALLKDKVTGTDYTMLSPYPSQDAPLKLTAWGHQLTPDSASDARVDEFLRGFVQGPQTPEPGAACSGAKDTP